MSGTTILATALLLLAPALPAEAKSRRPLRTGQLHMVMDSPYQMWSNSGTKVHLVVFTRSFRPVSGARILQGGKIRAPVRLAHLLAGARSALGGIEIGFEPRDQILEIIDLERQLHSAAAGRRQLGFHLGEPSLTLFDEQAHSRPLLGEGGKIGRAPRAFGGRLAADADEVGEIGGQHIGLFSQFGQQK